MVLGSLLTKTETVLGVWLGSGSGSSGWDLVGSG